MEYDIDMKFEIYVMYCS